MSLNERQLIELAEFCRDNKSVLNSSFNTSDSNKDKENLWKGMATKFASEGVRIDAKRLRKVTFSQFSFNQTLTDVKIS